MKMGETRAAKQQEWVFIRATLLRKLYHGSYNKADMYAWLFVLTSPTSSCYTV